MNTLVDGDGVQPGQMSACPGPPSCQAKGALVRVAKSLEAIQTYSNHIQTHFKHHSTPYAVTEASGEDLRGMERKFCVSAIQNDHHCIFLMQ